MSWTCSLSARPFLAKLHKSFVENVESEEDSLESLTSGYIRMGGLWWVIGSLDIMGFLHKEEKSSLKNHPELMTTKVTREYVLEFVKSCYDPDVKAFGPDKGHDAHIMSTLYGIFILKMYDAIHEVPIDAIVNQVASLQNPDGSFMGDIWGETDSRFLYAAVCILSLIGRLDVIDVEAAIEYVHRCQNLDGAFGSRPGSESHAAYTFCCIAALSYMDSLDLVDKDRLGQWLAERQIAGNCGGCNGRPEKAPDVCYSWWIIASLCMIDREHWIDAKALTDFILSSQDTDEGGIADRGEDMPDVFHTFFGIAGLSLLKAIPELNPVHPAMALRYIYVNIK